MSATYRVIGRLRPAKGYHFPPPKTWRVPEGSYPFYPILNEMVFTPITARAPVPPAQGIEELPTWVVPLVAPYPGQYEAAIAAVTRVMEEKWPGWALDFGYGSEMSVVLGGTTSRVETFFSYIRALLPALFLVSTAAFMVRLGQRRLPGCCPCWR
jgi:hypothetical protein